MTPVPSRSGTWQALDEGLLPPETAGLTAHRLSPRVTIWRDPGDGNRLTFKAQQGCCGKADGPPCWFCWVEDQPEGNRDDGPAS